MRGDPAVIASFQNYGYPAWFSAVIGICEVLGGLAFIFPKSRPYGAMLLTVIMAGAVFTHGSHGEYLQGLVPFALFLGLLPFVLRSKAKKKSQYPVDN